MSFAKIATALRPILRRAAAASFPTAGFATPSFHTVRAVAAHDLAERPVK